MDDAIGRTRHRWLSLAAVQLMRDRAFEISIRPLTLIGWSVALITAAIFAGLLSRGIWEGFSYGWSVFGL